MKHTGRQQQEFTETFSLDGGCQRTGQGVKVAPAKRSEQRAALQREVRELEYTHGGEGQMPEPVKAEYRAKVAERDGLTFDGEASFSMGGAL